MNACEDETEPFGESPDIDTLAAINRAAEIGMLSAGDKATATAQLAERQTQALNAVRQYIDTLFEKWVAQQSMPPYWELLNEIPRIIDEAGA